jgi:UrcA family protein
MKIGSKIPSQSITSILAATLVVLAFVAGSSPAMADSTDAVLTKTVKFGDLNLDSEQGAKALYLRLQSAAQFVCSPYDSADLARQRVFKGCVDKALASAVTEVNKPMVNALYNHNINRASAG